MPPRAGGREPRALFRHSKWDAVLVGLALVQGIILGWWPSPFIFGIGFWWCANTISHNFIHLPFFRARWLNVAFSSYLSLLLGIPQSLWRARHLAHHADRSWKWQWSPQLWCESALVAAWALWLGYAAPTYLTAIHLPGLLLGLGLCYVQGYFEHCRGAVSHYGWLYNFLFFNDGFHVEHHQAPARHWLTLRNHGASADGSRWPAVLRWLEGKSKVDGRASTARGKVEGRQSTIDRRTVAADPALRERRTMLPQRSDSSPSVYSGCSVVPPPLPCIPCRGSRLDSLERLVLRMPALQRFVLRHHERALRRLWARLPPVRRVGVVGGGLYPRTALILRQVDPDLELRIIDMAEPHLASARDFLPAGIEFRNAFVDVRQPNDALDDLDLVIFPLAFKGDRKALYRNPPAPFVFVHDWLWRPGSETAIVSFLLCKRINLIRQCLP